MFWIELRMTLRLFLVIVLLLVPYRDECFAEVTIKNDSVNHLVQLKITFQNPDFRTPWRKKNPSVRFAVGGYLGNNHILVPASNLSYHTLIEVRSLEESSAKKAKLLRIDYESDLAILEVKDPGKIFSGLKPLKFSPKIETNIPTMTHFLDANGESKLTRSRLENINMGHYPEALVDLPFVEFLSNEKQNGYGEIVLSNNGEPLGILNEFNTTSGKGKLIPSRIIHEFINGNDTFPFKGFLFRPLTDDTTSRYYGLKSDESGVIVTDVYLDSSAENILYPEDIITRIGEWDVDGKGRIDHPTYGKVSLSYLFHAGSEYGYSHGKTIPVDIIRNKKKIKVKMSLKPFPDNAILIPTGSPRDISPGYMIIGGLVFIDLTEFYMKEYGGNWRSKIDKKLLYQLDYHKLRKSKEDPSRLVLLVQVLPAEGNNGYHEFRQVALSAFNGKFPRDLNQLRDEISKLEESEFMQFSFDDGNSVVLKKSNANSIDLKIQKNYQIPKLYSPSRDSISHEEVSEK